MARPTNIRVEYSIDATINTGNFQNVKPGYKVSADVRDDQHPNEVREALKALADSWMEKDIQEHRDDAGL